MQLDDKQKRTLIALVCKVAWADGVVADEERAQVLALVQKVGGGAVSAAELDVWLTTGAPEHEISELPAPLREMLIYEAMTMIESDGDIADSELALIDSLLARVAKRHEPGMKLAKLAIVKRQA